MDEDKYWQKIDNLHRHKELTLDVKKKLKKEQGNLERRLILINVLLEKPTKKEKIR